jgi:hypothetical protein
LALNKVTQPPLFIKTFSLELPRNKKTWTRLAVDVIICSEDLHPSLNKAIVLRVLYSAAVN